MNILIQPVTSGNTENGETDNVCKKKDKLTPEPLAEGMNGEEFKEDNSDKDSLAPHRGEGKELISLIGTEELTPECNDYEK